MTIQPTPPKRARGGQPGNTNAVKTGFYSKQFKRTELKDLDKIKKSSLQDEIDMIRVFIRRIVEKAGNDTTIWEDITILRSLTIATHCLDRLTRTQRLTPEEDTMSLLQQALTEIYDEKGITAS